MKIKDVFQESSLSRVHGAMQKYACGAITAYRNCKEVADDGKSCAVLYTHAENQARNKSLLAKLQVKRCGVTAIMGSYIENFQQLNAKEVLEHSYFVTNLNVEGDDKGELERYLVTLGQEFDQDSIITIPFGKPAELIGTNHAEFPGFHQRMNLGGFGGGKAAEFMSRVNNRTFVFEDYNLPFERMGRWAVKVCSEKPWQDLID